MHWKDFFYYTRAERRSLRILLVLTALFIIVSFIAKTIKPRIPVETDAIMQALSMLESQTQDIPSTPVSEQNNRQTQDYKPPLRIDINLADTTDWQQISGIGPVFSRRIVSYRELLGGFYDPWQLLEVYGMDSVRFSRIYPFVYVSESNLRMIRINEAGYMDLLRHPYIDRTLAQAIYRYCRQHKPLSSVWDLTHSLLIDSTDLQKVMPYLSVE